LLEAPDSRKQHDEFIHSETESSEVPAAQSSQGRGQSSTRALPANDADKQRPVPRSKPRARALGGKKAAWVLPILPTLSIDLSTKLARPSLSLPAKSSSRLELDHDRFYPPYSTPYRRKTRCSVTTYSHEKQDDSCFNHSSLQAFPRDAIEVAAGQDANGVNNERLETLGDAILKLSITQQIFDAYPGLTPGGITEVRKLLESNEKLAEISTEYGLPEKLRIRAGARLAILAAGNVQADVFEAYVAAVHRQYGWTDTQDWLTKVFDADLRAAFAQVKAHGGNTAGGSINAITGNLIMRDIASIYDGQSHDYVSLLEVWKGRQPRTRVITWREGSKFGLDHMPQFEMLCLINGKVKGTGYGPNKKSAKNM
jgi:dsRNA-specific ribonuclease